MIDTEPLINIQLRNVPADLWHRLRVESVRRNLPLGTMVGVSIAAWLKDHEGK